MTTQFALIFQTLPFSTLIILEFDVYEYQNMHRL